VSFRAALDTHALIWAVLAPERLGLGARRIIFNAARGELAIPSPVIIELGRLIDADKLDLGSSSPADIFGETLAYHVVTPMSLDAAVRAPRLALPHGDPYDRMIVASALDLGLPLLTKDGNISDSGLVRVIW
jgi:PIN domain nuclease of toxin-antitoxin system